MISAAEKGPLYGAARRLYRGARGLVLGVRALRNSVLNRLDAPVLVLVYHRVADLPADPEMLAVSPQNFRRQMELLKRTWRVVRFEEDWSGLREPAVAVTFDDGYSDNLHEALPILEQAEVPATFFVSTGRLGTGREFWWHRLEGILLGEGSPPPRFSLRDTRFGGEWDTSTPQGRRELYSALVRLMHKIGPERREDWLDQLRIWSGREAGVEERHRSMTEAELRQLAANPWSTIGAHTVTHSALSALTEDQQRSEIFNSRKDLERILGEEIRTFSYPFGRRVDYNRTSVRLCREAGFVKAASNFPGQVHRWTDPFQLPRHLVRNWDETTFAAEMRGFWTR